MLKVKKIFGPTIQGEGKQSGFAAIFIRFSGCNMWNGKPEDRAESGCPFCDTDFFDGELMTAQQIVDLCDALRGRRRPYLVVLTGGEPMLQPSADLKKLIGLLHERGYVTQMETNGTIWKKEIAFELDFITVSPKKSLKDLKADLAVADCLKILYPHPTILVDDFLEMPSHPDFKHLDFCIQPIDEGGPEKWKENTKRAVNLVKQLGYPWRISIQNHKMLGEE